MEGILKYVIFSSAILLVWIPCAQATLGISPATIRNKKDCPGRGHDDNGYWEVDEVDGSKRCVLRCNDDYVPSGCHVLRRLDNSDWSFPEPQCQEKSLVSVPVMVGVGAAAASVAAAPVVLTGLGFGTAGIVSGSVAALAQTPTIAAGSWFAALQSAGMAGMTGLTKAMIGSTVGGLTYAASFMGIGCEAE